MVILHAKIYNINQLCKHFGIFVAYHGQNHVEFSYVQQLSWLIFSLIDEGERVEERHLAMGVDSLLNSQEQLFMQQIEPLTAYQMNFLRCIIDGNHDNFGETEIRETYNLGSVSNITRLKTALVEKDLAEMNGRRLYITDPVFAMWFKRNA